MLCAPGDQNQEHLARQTEKRKAVAIVRYKDKPAELLLDQEKIRGGLGQYLTGRGQV